MKKWKVSNLIRGYQIEENYVLANDEDEAYDPNAARKKSSGPKINVRKSKW